MAQSGDGSGSDPAADVERIGEDELAAYVRAAAAVRAIRKGETEPVDPAIRRRMVKAVEERGLTLERYNAITRRIRQDEDLYARYQEAWSREEGGGEG
ncbi:MAG: DUF4168 domain-containing protein [Thiohalorhabdus sp.]